MQPNIGNKGMQQIALVVCRKMYFACMYFEFFTGSKEMCDGCHHRKDFHTRAAVAILRISLFFFENTQNQGFSQFRNGQWSSKRKSEVIQLDFFGPLFRSESKS